MRSAPFTGWWALAHRRSSAMIRLGCSRCTCQGDWMLKQLPFGPLTLQSRYLLAPLAGYTTLGFRLAVRELGGLGLATTDLVNARALLRANARTMELIQTCPEDRPVAVQIYGSEPKEMGEAARWLEDYGVSA